MPDGIFHFSTYNLKGKTLLLSLSGGFVLINAALSFLGIWYFNLLPAVLLCLTVVFLSLEWGFFMVVFFTPVSIQLKEFLPGLEFDLYLPTEPLMFLILVLFIVKILVDTSFPRLVLKHPVSLAVLFYLIWLLITSITSSMPLVSFKFLLARIWFIAGFYFLGILVFRKSGHINRYILLYTAGMILVVAYTLWNHHKGGFINHEAAHDAAHPFFNDHTSYGAILAMLLPVLVVFSLTGEFSGWKQTIIRITTLLFLIALVLSYSRAAWLSFIVAVLIFVIVKLKVRFVFILLFSLLSFLVLAFYWPNIEMRLEKNRQESSASLSQHVQSISNISSDASNLERINRWKSALRMFRKRAVFGWGPGTYMFQYAAFQSSNEKTIISTNFGDRGNAHSEYIGAMAESGVLGMVSYVLILVLGLHTGFRNFSSRSKTSDNYILLSVCLGLITYVFHGFLNNFLDTDKASVLFWGYLGIIVAMDLQRSKTNTPVR